MTWQQLALAGGLLYVIAAALLLAWFRDPSCPEPSLGDYEGDAQNHRGWMP